VATSDTCVDVEPKSIAGALKPPDTSAAAVLAEIEAHLQNGTWELAQLPPGRRAIGIHYGGVFASTARMAAVHALIAIVTTEDLELESVDISMA